MKTKHASHFIRTARLHGRAVYWLSAPAFAVVALLLIWGCGKSDAPKSAQPSGQPSAQATGEVSPSAPEPAQPSSPPADLAGVSRQRNREIIKFIPRGFAPMGQIPFTMDATLSPDHPAVIGGTPLPESEHERVRALLQREIDRYPPGVLTGTGSNVLGMVMVGDKITINRESVSGAYMAGGLVFISVGAAPKPAPEREVYIARTFHHELSSAFRDYYAQKFDEKRFRDALPPGFVYDDEKPGADPRVDPMGVNAVGNIQDVADGFLTQYAKTTLGQDFNSYAEVLLWKPELLLETFAPDSRAGRKARVVRDFYIAIDRRFEDYFTPHRK